MSIRLQILLNEEEMEEIKKLSQQEHLTVSAWVRRAIRHEKRDRPGTAAKRKLDIVKKSSEYQFPTEDIEKMVAEIESGYIRD